MGHGLAWLEIPPATPCWLPDRISHRGLTHTRRTLSEPSALRPSLELSLLDPPVVP